MHVEGPAWSGAAGSERSLMQWDVTRVAGLGTESLPATVPQDDETLRARMDASHEELCRAQRRLFTLIAEADRRFLWGGDGAHDMAHWLRMRYGISDWKARRWIDASHAL